MTPTAKESLAWQDSQESLEEMDNLEPKERKENQVSVLNVQMHVCVGRLQVAKITVSNN